MGLSHSPSIVLDGLLFYIDVYNQRSYPGTGVSIINLVNLVSGIGDSATAISASGGILFGTNKNSFVDANLTVSNTAYTKICWFNLDDTTTYQPLICGTNSTRHCMWMNKTAKLTASHSNTSSFSTPVFTSVAGNTTLSTGVWYFGAVTYSSSSGFNIYLNGVLDQTSASTQTFGASSTQNYVGFFGDFFTSPALPTLNGKIGPVMIYNKVLTASEILKLYNASKRRFGLS
jgi:hypothetical protein